MIAMWCDADADDVNWNLNIFRGASFSKRIRFLPFFWSLSSSFSLPHRNPFCVMPKKTLFAMMQRHMCTWTYLCSVQSPLLTFIPIICTVCVLCTIYLYTLILHITYIMYWLPQTFVAIVEKREKNHTASTIAFSIHSGEKRRLVHRAELSCVCVCVRIWIRVCTHESSFDPQHFHKKSYVNVRLYCCTFCTHTVWYIFVHWVWVYIRCFCWCFFFGCRKLHEEWWWFPLLNLAADFFFSRSCYTNMHTHFYSFSFFSQPITVLLASCQTFLLKNNPSHELWQHVRAQCTRTVWNFSKSIIMWCIV